MQQERAAPAQLPARLLPAPPSTLPAACGIALCLTGKLSAHCVSTPDIAGISHHRSPGAAEMCQRRLLAQQHGMRPSAITNFHTHYRDPSMLTPAVTGWCCTHAWLPYLDFSDKNNYRPLQHKGLFICLGQWLRLVSVIEMNHFEQAWAARKDQRCGNSEKGLTDEGRGPGEHPLTTPAP